MSNDLNRIVMYMGRDIEGYSKEELIDIINSLQSDYDRQSKRHIEELDLLSSLRDANKKKGFLSWVFGR